MTTALLAPTVGGGIAAASSGLAYAAPVLMALTDTLWAAVALIAAGGVVAIARPRPGIARQAHVTQHITATGCLAGHRATSISAEP